MISILDYVAKGSTVGSKWNIWIPEGFFHTVGSGAIKKADAAALAFTGKIETVFFSKDLDIEVGLIDGNLSGNASLRIGQQSAKAAKYIAQDAQLIVDAQFDTGTQRIVLSRGNGDKETDIDLAGIYNHTVHLVPPS